MKKNSFGFCEAEALVYGSIGVAILAGAVIVALTETPEEKKQYQEQRKKWEEREAEAKERNSWYQQV